MRKDQHEKNRLFLVKKLQLYRHKERRKRRFQIDRDVKRVKKYPFF